MHRSILPSCLVVVLGVPSPGQAYSGVVNQVPWDSSLDPTTGSVFRGVWIGHFDDDGYPDAVVLRGDRLVVLQSPAITHLYGPFGGPTSAFAPWPGEGADRGVAAGPQGLFVLHPEPGNPAPGIPLDVEGTEQARGLELRRHPTSGADWLAVQQATGRSFVLGTLSDGSAGGAHFTERTRLTVNQEVLAWDLVDWDGDPEFELFLHLSTTLTVLETDGTPVLVQPLNPVGSLPLVGAFQTSAGPERVFWVSETTNPLEWIGIAVDLQFPVLEPPTFQGPLSIGQLGFADYDGDGACDVWLSTRSTAQAWILYGNPDAMFPAEPGFLLDPARTSVLDLDPQAVFDPTTASLGDTADLDLDGDVDFLFVSDDSLQVSLFRGDSIDEEPRTPRLRSFTDDSESYPTQVELHIEVPFASYSRALPTLPGPSPSANLDRRRLNPTSLQALGIRVWRQSNPGSPVDPVPVVDQTVALTTHRRTLPVSVSLGSATDSNDVVHQVLITPLDADGRPIGPSWIGYFAKGDETHTLLSSQPNPWNAPPVPSSGDGTSGFHRRPFIGSFCWGCP